MRTNVFQVSIDFQVIDQKRLRLRICPDNHTTQKRLCVFVPHSDDVVDLECIYLVPRIESCNDFMFLFVFVFVFAFVVVWLNSTVVTVICVAVA